ncbi:MAG: hypothetical protein ACO1SV_08080 [Fimbriimonas sp.]
MPHPNTEPECRLPAATAGTGSSKQESPARSWSGGLPVPASAKAERRYQPVWKPISGVDSSDLPLLIEAGLANPDGTCTVEQTRLIMLADLIIDFYLEWNER